MDEAEAVAVVHTTINAGLGLSGADLAQRVVAALHAAGYAGAVPVEMPAVWQWRTPVAPMWMDCEGKRHADRLLEAYGGQLRYRYESEWSEPSAPVTRSMGAR